MSKTKKLYILICTIAIIGIILDMLLKQLTTGVLSPFIPEVVSICFTWNTGAGWSILSSHTLLLTIISAFLILGVIIFLIFYKPKHTLFAISFGLILAGAIGNLIDRIIFGAVRDFVCLEFINFPIFNLADTFLTIGAILLAIYLIFYLPQKEKSNGKRKV